VALTILALAEAHRQAGRPLRVLITAQTHTAIDNCLAKLSELQADHRVFGGDLPLRKLTTPGGDVESLGHSDAPGWAAEHPICVLGSTVWQVHRVPPDHLAFDLMVVDEGSQVKVGEAAIPLLRLAEGGRLVIAGDDKQLPPIVVGAYPEIAGEPLLHRSILEAIRHRDPDDVLTAPLLENWRMCDVPGRVDLPGRLCTSDTADRRTEAAGSSHCRVGVERRPPRPAVPTGGMRARERADHGGEPYRSRVGGRRHGGAAVAVR
jgi:hypothetical protein